MLYQSFTVRGYKKVLSGKEFRAERNIRTIKDLLPHMNKAETEVANRSISFDNLLVTMKCGKPIFQAPDLKTTVVLKKLNDNLKRVFSVKQSDRDKLIRTIDVLLCENTPFYILKGDIQDFYESIPRRRVLNNIFNNHLLSYESKWLLDRIFSSKQIAPIPGLPTFVKIDVAFPKLPCL